MAWNDNPQVRDLAAWAKKHGYDQVIAVVFNYDGSTPAEAGYVSYGKTKKLCDTAKEFGEVVYDKLMDSELVMNEAGK